MMDFRTYISIPKSTFAIGYDTRMMLFGSCFSENIGNLLVENKFRADVNPFGILYNPLSISVAMNRILNKEVFTENELVFRNGLFHSFLHHGSFSAETKEECLSTVSRRFSTAAEEIGQTNVFLFTFGTAFVYRLAQSGEIVGNCHKFPETTFSRSRLAVDDIAGVWTRLIRRLLLLNPKIKIIFTVSPIRHWKDGAHENQVSKSILHLAIDTLQSEFRDCVHYFPAYEIVMDELRDYRFYAEDMTHPSDTAVAYLWERLGETYFSDETQKTIAEWQKIHRALTHRPRNTEGAEYRDFLLQTIASLENFAAKHPNIPCSQEIEHANHLLETR
ncbi:MAG: GSCFA domain-containing protein [Dysgonamonadaceae bacterium]|jgi:hypothetical protein|nr:GSCFA domain-containing protein [Dysgonamonadaceae bacterium]